MKNNYGTYTRLQRELNLLVWRFDKIRKEMIIIIRYKLNCTDQPWPGLWF